MPDKRADRLINGIAFVFLPFADKLDTDRKTSAAVEATVFHILTHSAHHVFPKLSNIFRRHRHMDGLGNLTAIAIVKDLRCVFNADALPVQCIFVSVKPAVFFAADPVKRIGNHNVKFIVFRVFDQLQKIAALFHIVRRGFRAVGIHPNQTVALAVDVFHTGVHLLFDTGFLLLFRAVACVDDCAVFDDLHFPEIFHFTFQ